MNLENNIEIILKRFTLINLLIKIYKLQTIFIMTILYLLIK